MESAWTRICNPMQPITLNSMPKEMKPSRWRFMLVGSVGAGKTTLLHALEGKDPHAARKTQMIDYSNWGIDTPGEFTEMGRLRSMLTASSFDASILLAVQDATNEASYFPPNYFLMFPQHVIGVVTKTDDPTADAERAETLLRQAGVMGEIFYVSALTGKGVLELKEHLLSQNL